jgi:hypothetical protein
MISTAPDGVGNGVGGWAGTFNDSCQRTTQWEQRPSLSLPQDDWVALPVAGSAEIGIVRVAGRFVW